MRRKNKFFYFISHFLSINIPFYTMTVPYACHYISRTYCRISIFSNFHITVTCIYFNFFKVICNKFINFINIFILYTWYIKGLSCSYMKSSISPCFSNFLNIFKIFCINSSSWYTHLKHKLSWNF